MTYGYPKIFGLLSLFIFLTNHPIHGSIIPCPSACKCRPTSPNRPYRFALIECSSSTLPIFTSFPNISFNARVLNIQSDMSKLPAFYLSMFQSIDSLVLVHTGQGDQYWDDHAFDDVLIRKFSISDLNGVLPPPVALEKLGQSLTRLNVHGDRSAKLENNCFKNFSNLEILMINSSSVQMMGNEPFSGLENSLQTLEIMDTHLPRFPPIGNLKEMYRLALHNNTLKKIPENMFSNLTHLVDLSLDYNELGPAIKKGASLPSNLSDLSLKGIGLKSIPNFLISLGTRSLHLEENQIQEIRSYDFKGAVNLEEINLSKNPISKIDNGSFGHVETLRVLKLEDTNLTTMDLSICDQLQECHIYGNQNAYLKNLVVGDMKKTPTSITIWLRDTGLETIDPKLTDLMNRTKTFLLDIRHSRNLHCGDLHWMAPVYVCQPTPTILAQEALCADKNQDFDVYMNSVFSKSNCPKVITDPTEGNPCLKLTC